MVLGFIRPDLHFIVFTGAARENWFSGIKFTDDRISFHCLEGNIPFTHVRLIIAV